MTKEEAIEWLIQIKDKYIHDGDEQFDTKRKEELGMAIEALKSDRPKGEWIPCSERLPEESGKYLITANDGIHKRTTVAKYQNRHKTWEMTGRMAFWKVLAWMPMPSPWKGDK